MTLTVLFSLCLAAPAAAALPELPVPHHGPAMQKLSKYMDQRLAAGKNQAELDKIDAAIRKDFEKTLAIMITDMSGFTELTKKRGILGFLTEIRRLQRLAAPIIKKNGGEWVKADADDLFVTHTSAAAMYALAKDLLAGVEKSNADNEWKMGLAIGLGFGPTLMIGDEDTWGDSVNTASKLGEDTAKANEILVSETFYQRLSEERKQRNEAMPACERQEAGTRETKFPFYSCR
ncbi:MAG: adenylate/guanylate cyclase domain-containing protein [Deltaproteobacteria bacterium]|nr:adenylate/guanylate cyclase domain-containing protein [Deltaproteobacteria bacterium]